MAYREYLPCRALRPYVDRFWTEDGQSVAATKRILPDGCIDILVRGPATALAVGTMTRSLWIPYDGTAYAGVRFRPGVAPAFLKVPAKALTDLALPLGMLIGREAEPLEEAMQADAKRCLPLTLRALEKFLLARLARGLELPRWSALGPASALPPRVDDLARRAGLSARQLERLFLFWFGVGPKTYLRVSRLQSAVAQLRRSAAKPSWADLALHCGYFDQAHLIREFKLLTDQTPTDFLHTEFPMSDLSNTARPRAGRF